MNKFLSVVVAGFGLFLFQPHPVIAYAKGSQSCLECHKLDAQGAKDVMSRLVPDVKVLNVDEGPVAGLWEVGFESGGKKSIAYLDYSLKYIIAGNILSLAEKKNLTQESYLKINKIEFSQIPLQNALVLGDKKASHKVVVFDDPD